MARLRGGRGPGVAHAAGPSPLRLAPGDVDGVGKADPAFAADDEVRIFRGRAPPRSTSTPFTQTSPTVRRTSMHECDPSRMRLFRNPLPWLALAVVALLLQSRALDLRLISAGFCGIAVIAAAEPRRDRSMWEAVRNRRRRRRLRLLRAGRRQ
jgi:hypothetical protein